MGQIMENLISLNRIKEMLEDRRLTVVADRCGMSYPTVQNVANGSENVSLRTWRKLSDYFTPTIDE